MSRKIHFVATSLALFVLLNASLASIAAAQRPTAPRLLPEDTVAYLRVADMPTLIEKFQETSMGRISQDDQVRPLLEHLWQALTEAAEELEEEMGASLAELMAIPQGETAIALVLPETGRPAVVMLMDANERMPIIEKILERVEQGMAEEGAERTTESARGTELVTHTFPGDRQREMVYLKRDGTLAISSNVDVMKSMLAAWRGEATSTLSDNTDFTAIMKRCVGEEGETPQITFFVDAIPLVKRVAGGNVAGATFLALLPALGLDGIRGAGGSIAFASERYDSVAHMHLLLDNPRKGIPAMLAMRGGDLTPEPWVPPDAVTYASLNWDIETSYNALQTFYDAIRGEGALKRDMDQRLSDPLGVDFKTEMLDAFEGRITHVSWMVRPARLNSRANLVAFKLNDATEFRKTWLKMSERFEGQLERQALGSTEFWKIRTGPQESERPDQPFIRRPDPAVTIMGDYLMLSDSTDLLRQAISTKGDTSVGLANQLDFRLIASKIRRQNGGDNPGLLSFNRPEESMRLIYELATAETTRERLASQAENNRFFGTLDEALRENPLPPFAAIARYLAPGGSLMTSDETGFHFTAFTLRRD